MPQTSVADGKAQRQPTTKLCDDLEGEAFQEWRQANDQLMRFYRDNKFQLDKIDYGTAAATLSPVVASCFRGSSWKDFACALGIPDSELEGVDQWAERCKLMPLQVALQHLYPALKACSKRCSLGHLVDVLKEQGRLDVLNKISRHVKGLLSESPRETCCFEESHLKKLVDSQSSLSSMDSGVSSLDVGDFLGDPEAKDSILFGSAPRQAALPYSPCSKNGAIVSKAFSPESNSCTTPPSFANPDNVSSSHNNNEHVEEEESICESLIDKILPKAKLDDDKLTVFVSHLEEDVGLAQELAKILETEHECYVLTQAEIQPALHTNPTLIEDLIQKVKAIVPLVTRAYLDHYEHTRRTIDLNSADSVLTHEVYTLFLHRLVSSSCLYYMLFPVRTPDVKYTEVRHHHIFAKSKVLCKEDLARLVTNMHGCRKLRLSNERRGS